MFFEFDFGFETPGVSMEQANIAFLFACTGELSDLGRAAGPLAIAHASRYVEYFEMQIGVSPLDSGVHSRVLGGPSLSGTVWDTIVASKSRKPLPIVIGEDRRTTEQACCRPLVALWGSLGRREADEFPVLNANRTVLAGVRASSFHAFKSLPTEVTTLTARTVQLDQTELEQALDELQGPVHLSIDLDVLSPGVAQTPRSLEPGGLSWYDLMDLTQLVFRNPGVASVDLVGTGQVEPNSTAALIGAQILVRLGALAITVAGR